MKFISFDTETTGLDAKNCRVIELAAEAYDEDFNIIDWMDMLIMLPDGEKIPERIIELTGITNNLLKERGVEEVVAAKRFSDMISGDEVILVAHNAHFDLSFVSWLLYRNLDKVPEGLGNLKNADYIDTLTISRDRKMYPHTLKDMIEHYKLDAKNTHRAIDDAHGVTELLKALNNERADIFHYLNVFGYNPKYGISGNKIGKVAYFPQPYRSDTDLVEEKDILPRIGK